jgi:hypothetical protein
MQPLNFSHQGSSRKNGVNLAENIALVNEQERILPRLIARRVTHEKAINR